MRILTYKVTPVGDRGPDGRFGIHDCMGRIRGYAFDAVIGFGGIGQEPKNFGIARKLNWVGIGPQRQERLVAMNPSGQKSVRGFVLAFEKFFYLGKQGPLLHDSAPVLAKRVYGGSLASYWTTTLCQSTGRPLKFWSGP